MNTEWIRTYVQEKREELIDNSNDGGYDEYVYGDGVPAFRLAFGLVALRKTTEAKNWFKPLANVWAVGAPSAKQWRFEKGRTHAGDLPQKYWFRAVASAVMSDHPQQQSDTGHKVHDQITNPEHNNLEGRDQQTRIDAWAGVAALLSGRDVQPHIADIRTHAANRSEKRNPYAWESEPFGLPQAKILEGIDTGNPELVSTGLNELSSFHEEYQVEAKDDHRMQREIDFPTTMYVVLARQNGFDIEIDNPHIPEAVFDDESYPVGGTDSR